MRVVIAESSLRDGRKLAAEIESLLPSADVLLYSDPDAAIAGIKNHQPDVVVAAPKVGGLDGPDFLARVRDLEGIDAKLVGGVDQPDAGALRRCRCGTRRPSAGQPALAARGTAPSRRRHLLTP
jgi:hypothetical protein